MGSLRPRCEAERRANETAHTHLRLRLRGLEPVGVAPLYCSLGGFAFWRKINIRVKNYPWGDGDKTLFWNNSVNYHNKDKTT